MTKTITRPSWEALMAESGFGNRTLTPTNLRVKGVARKMNWNAETVIRRVQNALPAPVEQQIYLEVALSYRIYPESLKKMLDVFRESDALRDIDRDWFSVGPNLVKSRFDDVINKVEQALKLVDKDSDEADFMMSMKSAAQLVESYGEHAEDVLGVIIENVAEVARLLDIKSEVPRVIVGLAVKDLAKNISHYPIGSPLPLTIEEMFGHSLRKRGDY